MVDTARGLAREDKCRLMHAMRWVNVNVAIALVIVAGGCGAQEKPSCTLAENAYSPSSVQAQLRSPFLSPSSLDQIAQTAESCADQVRRPLRGRYLTLAAASYERAARFYTLLGQRDKAFQDSVSARVLAGLAANERNGANHTQPPNTNASRK